MFIGSAMRKSSLLESELFPKEWNVAWSTVVVATRLSAPISSHDAVIWSFPLSNSIVDGVLTAARKSSSVPPPPPDPGGPVGPAGPVGPVAPPPGPVGPVGPAGPVGPVAPERPVAPVGPVSPAGPVGPVAPAPGPMGPVGPAAPVTPASRSHRGTVASDRPEPPRLLHPHRRHPARIEQPDLHEQAASRGTSPLAGRRGAPAPSLPDNFRRRRAGALRLGGPS